MNKNRVISFSDSVLGIVITIMAFELKAPSKPDLSSLINTLGKSPSSILAFLNPVCNSMGGGK